MIKPADAIKGLVAPRAQKIFLIHLSHPWQSKDRPFELAIVYVCAALGPSEVQ